MTWLTFLSRQEDSPLLTSFVIVVHHIWDISKADVSFSHILEVTYASFPSLSVLSLLHWKVWLTFLCFSLHGSVRSSHFLTGCHLLSLPEAPQFPCLNRNYWEPNWFIPVISRDLLPLTKVFLSRHWFWNTLLEV